MQEHPHINDQNECLYVCVNYLNLKRRYFCYKIQIIKQNLHFQGMFNEFFFVCFYYSQADRVDRGAEERVAALG